MDQPRLSARKGNTMLKKCDLSKKTDDKTFADKIAPLQERLGELQRQLRDERIPVIILVEGWNASGITMTIQEIIRFLDPGDSPSPPSVHQPMRNRNTRSCGGSGTAFLRSGGLRSLHGAGTAGRLPRIPMARAGRHAWTGPFVPSTGSSAISRMTGRLLSRYFSTSAKKSRKNGSLFGKQIRSPRG